MLTDPYIILGLDREPTDEDVRKAYLEAIRLCPPEKDADTFQRIQMAYDVIKTKRQRMELKLFNRQSPTLEDILGQAISQPPVSTQRPNLSTIQALLRQSFK